MNVKSNESPASHFTPPSRIENGSLECTPPQMRASSTTLSEYATNQIPFSLLQNRQLINQTPSPAPQGEHPVSFPYSNVPIFPWAVQGINPRSQPSAATLFPSRPSIVQSRLLKPVNYQIPRPSAVPSAVRLEPQPSSKEVQAKNLPSAPAALAENSTNTDADDDYSWLDDDEIEEFSFQETATVPQETSSNFQADAAEPQSRHKGRTKGSLKKHKGRTKSNSRKIPESRPEKINLSQPTISPKQEITQALDAETLESEQKKRLSFLYVSSSRKGDNYSRCRAHY